jgi:phage gpG-like protein
LFDQNADFDGTSTFTAPVTGRYFVSVRAQWDSLTSSNTAANHALISSNRTYSAIYQDAGATQVGGSLRVAYSMFVDMDASDTFTTTGGVSGTTAVVDVGGQATPTVQLSVYLAA